MKKIVASLALATLMALSAVGPAFASTPVMTFSPPYTSTCINTTNNWLITFNFDSSIRYVTIAVDWKDGSQSTVIQNWNGPASGTPYVSHRYTSTGGYASKTYYPVASLGYSILINGLWTPQYPIQRQVTVSVSRCGS